ELRIAHTTLFPHITSEGVRLTEIADKLGVTKQAIGPLVDDLERGGVVERGVDPADHRAKQIRRTKRRRPALRHGLGVLAELEAELAKTVGKRRLAVLANTLEAVIRAIEETR